jgi:hypothetical protein
LGLLKRIETRGPQRVELSGPDGGPPYASDPEQERRVVWALTSTPEAIAAVQAVALAAENGDLPPPAPGSRPAPEG